MVSGGEGRNVGVRGRSVWSTGEGSRKEEGVQQAVCYRAGGETGSWFWRRRGSSEDL